MYEYQARCINVVDGDTIDVIIDMGFNIRREIRLRIANIDTHEISFVDHDSEEYKQGKIEAKFVEDWFNDAQDNFDGDWPLLVRTEKKGKYGRYIAYVERKDTTAELSETILDTFDDVAY